ncbi:hypothetical protein HH310_12405 [Actinoplanes sp. TBRC 11911]|uniref:hypothetical protein n=1 Tax=Actinoplanes sp. TBRC 11911 TaxID=2729386 RepID=UPI00145CB212|nr:hypothetical protein [Actinoplanes sp. TBRC 11911]NMO51995.1 hypothetical protein [Actinoplanes sp. TBRC 11911]
MAARNIQLEPEHVELLRAAAAGQVHRHRLRRTDSPEDGQDYQQVDGHGPGGLRKATARLRPLQSQLLVFLHRGQPSDEKWPWRTTELGDTLLDVVDQDLPAATDRVEQAELSTHLDRATARIADLHAALAQVLRTFVQPARPGQESLRASYVEKEAVLVWNRVLDGTLTSRGLVPAEAWATYAGLADGSTARAVDELRAAAAGAAESAAAAAPGSAYRVRHDATAAAFTRAAAIVEEILQQTIAQKPAA